MKTISKLALIFLCLFAVACNEKAKNTKDQSLRESIFPKGKPGPAENFTGKAWNYSMLDPDTTYTTAVGNVYFEPGARTTWHSHPAGQILVITDGVGYHQIKGQPKQTIHKGDVIKCPPGVLHWHGASRDTGLQQLYIVPNTEKGVVQWTQPVTDKEYDN